MLWPLFSVWRSFFIYSIFFLRLNFPAAGSKLHADHCLVKLWNSFCGGSVVAKDDHILQFADNTISWACDCLIPKLYKRAVYDEIYDCVRSGKLNKILILGTPGIGKTLLHMYLMYRLVRDSAPKGNKKTATPFAPPTFVLRNKDQIEYFFSLEGGKPVVTQLSSNQPVIADYYFSDTYAVATAQARSCVVHVSSVQTHAYADYEKAVSQLQGDKPPTGLIKHMSVFTLEEALGLARMREIPKGEMIFHFDIFGGSARLLTSSFDELQSVENIEKMVSDEMDAYFEGVYSTDSLKVLVKAKYTVYWHKAINMIVNLCIRGQSQTGDALDLLRRSMFQHSVVIDGVVKHGVWASGFMKSLGGAILDESNQTIMTELRNILNKSNSAFGAVFERCAHRSIYNALSKNKSLSMSALTTVGKGQKVITTLSCKVKRKVMIRTVEDIAALADGDYGYPSIPNFPLVDAVIKPNVMLQMYAGDGCRHAARSCVASLKAVQSQMGGVKKLHQMVFVINPNNTQFGSQSRLIVNQYALKFDIIADAIVDQSPSSSNASAGKKRRLS